MVQGFKVETFKGSRFKILYRLCRRGTT